ncbi:MAG: hypothetical protein K2I36_00525 [Ureaplasma sp.]|nr:hypothetical protein [Ureaplasma sp.]
MKKQNTTLFPFALPDPNLLYKQMEQINKNMKKLVDETIRTSFRGIIQPSFLVKMKYFIMNSQEFLAIAKSKYDPMGVIGNNPFGIQCFDMDLVTVEDVCKNIAFIHQYNMTIEKNPSDFEDETREGRAYFEKLKRQVLENINFREFGSSTFSKHYTVGFYPYLYALRVTVHFLSVELDKVLATHFNNATGIERFRLRTISDIFRRARGILGLMDDDCTDACYGICRQIIEFYAQYSILIRYPNAIDEYGKFVNYQLEYNTTKNFPIEFEKKFYSKFKIDDENKPMKVKYLNYGWIDKIDEFGYIENKKYTIRELFEFIDLQNGLDRKKVKGGKIMEENYEKCSLLSHGNQVMLNVFLGNIEIVTYIFPVIEALAKDLRDMFGIPIEIDGINILEYTRKKVDAAVNIYKTISNDSELGERNQKLFMR